MSFTSLGLTPPLLRAIAEQGFELPSPIQAQSIPAALRGEDVLACAQTGSGKTAAYALPIMQALLSQPAQKPPRRTQALVLVPTRELAIQVGEFLRTLADCVALPPRVALLFGGVSINPQLMGLRGGAEIVVATPGRLLDVVEHNALSLGNVQTLVLDEADRLLDLGFAEELARVLALLPAQRQQLLFSATFAPAVQELAQRLLKPDALRIALDEQTEAAPDIVQRAIAVDAPQRTQLLRHLIVSEAWPQVLVFVATQYATELVAHKLARVGLRAAALHGELSQGARSEALEAFKAGELQVLVATDLAARGLHIARLPVVVNYDLPRAAADYTHRIGRTGRAGESGLALSFVSAATEAHWRLIEKRCGLPRTPREQIAGFEPTEVATPEQAVGGVKSTTRKSKKDKLREAQAAAAAAADAKPKR
ncbi:DEAD/DEAH box helicase [Roseateles sp.]|jgi:ATP-dependent RNA helicase RhlE|uniref:DEAD/DEAH box helicase n=1 Tax=Roseateles sp. TaxID=1971397 RepID=UPI0037CBE2D8